MVLLFLGILLYPRKRIISGVGPGSIIRNILSLHREYSSWGVGENHPSFLPI